MRTQQRSSQHTQDAEAQTQPPASATRETGSVDALLDEIDDVLEENAEAFVEGFVQKGGE